MKRHRADLVSLFFGLLFVVVAGWWAVSYYLDWRIDWNVPNLGWIAAGALILVGLLGVVASLRGERRVPEPVEPPTMPPTPLPTDPMESTVDTVDTADLVEPITVPDDEPPTEDRPPPAP